MTEPITVETMPERYPDFHWYSPEPTLEEAIAFIEAQITALSEITPETPEEVEGLLAALDTLDYDLQTLRAL